MESRCVAEGGAVGGQDKANEAHAGNPTLSFIPVLVTGIQPRRVGAVNDSHAMKSFARAQGRGRTGFM